MQNSQSFKLLMNQTREGIFSRMKRETSGNTLIYIHSHTFSHSLRYTSGKSRYLTAIEEKM